MRVLAQYDGPFEGQAFINMRPDSEVVGERWITDEPYTGPEAAGAVVNEHHEYLWLGSLTLP